MLLEKGAATAAVILESIAADPSSHDQLRWVCASTMCVAGHAAHVHGMSLKHIGATSEIVASWNDLFLFEGGEDPYPANRLVQYAAGLLGLTPLDAVILFYATTNKEAVEALEWIAAGKKLNWDEIGASVYDERPRQAPRAVPKGAV